MDKHLEEKRVSQRLNVVVDIKITHPHVGVKIVKTRNISDSGLFLLVEPTTMPPVGDVVVGEVVGLIGDVSCVEMKIVRIEEDGIGLQFCEK